MLHNVCVLIAYQVVGFFFVITGIVRLDVKTVGLMTGLDLHLVDYHA